MKDSPDVYDSLNIFHSYIIIIIMSMFLLVIEIVCEIMCIQIIDY